MARGFESKSVADQQESREQERDRDREAQNEAVATTRRRGLELARADVLRKILEARAEPHRAMLRKALAALEADLAKLTSS
jgi:hypothetical protein